MKMTAETIQKVREVAQAALTRMNAADVAKGVDLALSFAKGQASGEIVLDGKRVEAVAVDIANVFSLEGNYHQIVDENGGVHTVESEQALSIVIVGNDVKLCKSTFDVIPDSASGEERFVNAVYWTTAVDALTEKYVC